MTVYLIDLPWRRVKGIEKPLPPLSLNLRQHRMKEANVAAAIRAHTADAARSAGIPAATAIWVRLHYIPPTKGRRDADNLIPTQKPAVDGLVDAGVIPDDCIPYLDWSAPVIYTHLGTKKTARLWLEVRLLDEPVAWPTLPLNLAA